MLPSLTIPNFWSSEKCSAFIQQSEAIGYEEALVQTARGQRRMAGVRNNQRVLFDDHQLAKAIWEDLSPHVPVKLGNSKAIGLNERFRFYKYEPGQQFRKHRDQSFIRNAEEASFYTFMIYLNEDFEGGETTFNEITIKPKTGMALLFEHQLEHEGSTLVSGTKYVLRTDVMYRLMGQD